MFESIVRLPRTILIGFVRFYQVVIGPAFPSSCRYYPSCSSYSIQALQKYGAARGFILTVWRLLRCAPWGKGGFDPPRWFGEPIVEEDHSHEHEHEHRHA